MRHAWFRGSECGLEGLGCSGSQGPGGFGLDWRRLG